VFSFKGDWLFAMKYAERLFNESRWSRSTYAYLKASFLLMMTENNNTREHVTYMMQSVFLLSVLTKRFHTLSHMPSDL